MRAVPVPGGYLVNGAKKPCSLSRSMDLLTASVGCDRRTARWRMGLLMLPADTRASSVHPFWSTFALAGAESDEVRLTDVLVAPEQIIAPGPGARRRPWTELTTVGLIWFELTVCAAYTGIATVAGGAGAARRARAACPTGPRWPCGSRRPPR